MDRKTEPELMEGIEQSTAYARADFAEVNAGFVASLLAKVPDLSSHVIDLGCGPADIPIRLCQTNPNLYVTAVDGSTAMINLARDAVAAAGLSERVTLVTQTLPADLGTQRFEGVISNSLLHHLHRPEVLWNTLREVGAPGAAVFIVDLRRPASEVEAQAIVDTYAADEPDVLRHDFYHSLLAAFTPDEVKAQLESAGLGQLEVEATTDRHMCIWGRLT